MRSSQPPNADTYRGHHTARFHARRTAESFAWFLTPHLRPGMRLLDCGCGPGTITVGLAEAVAPGEVVGIDLSTAQIDRARALVHDRGLTNVHIEAADILALPFPDADFDAVYSSNALEYLAEPLAGIMEMRRVLKPGGVIGIVDADVSTVRLAPESPFTREFLPLFLRYRELGASPYYSSQLRPLLRRAGFTRREAFGFTEHLATPAATRPLAEGLVEVLGLIEAGLRDDPQWAVGARLDELICGVRAWGEDPDAMWTVIQFAALGWVE